MLRERSHLGILLLVELPDDGKVVASDDVKAQIDQLDGRVEREGALMRFRQHNVLHLVVSLERSYKATSVAANNVDFLWS